MKTLERIIEKVSQMEYEWFPSVSVFFEDDESYIIASFSDDFIAMAKEMREAIDDELFEKAILIENTIKEYIDLITHCFSTLPSLGQKTFVDGMWRSSKNIFGC